VSTPAVTVDHVSKKFRLYHDRNQSLKAVVMRGGRARYEEFWALRDVSLEVRQGITFGIIGTNGSGKSTLLKCLARILRPDEGTTTTHGKVSALLELGAGFHQELSGRENVYLNGSILGLSKRELDNRFDDIVEFAGLERFIDTPVKNYSSGMYVRLGFSVAINVDPEILLVDEVLAVGDEEFQRRCAERIADLRDEGKTIVVVSHALGSIQNICDEVAWLDQGMLKEVGPAADVCSHYLGNVHVARLASADATGVRWGSGEVRITDIELLGPGGSTRAEVATGDELTIRCHYQCEQRIDHPVFIVSLHRSDGVQVTSPTTRDAGLELDHITGSGIVDLVIPALSLLPGTYDVSAGVTDRSSLHVYDQHHREVRLDVAPGHPNESLGGVVTLNGRWSWRPTDPSSP
jgi:ABC-2 type transport system ATP-binding protein